MLFLVGFSCLILNFTPVAAQQQQTGLSADISTELGQAGSASTLGNQDPRAIVAKIITVALSLLGVIFLVLTVYAGFQWMTAGGEESKVEEATKLLKNAVIGLVIVILAYSITVFVVENLAPAAGPSTAPAGGPTGGGSNLLPGEVQCTTCGTYGTCSLPDGSLVGCCTHCYP